MAQRSQTLERHIFPSDWTQPEVQSWLEVWKSVRAAKADLRRVVFVSGVFDLLHSEHIEFLRRARRAGNFLVVGLESDARVRETKGPDRPIESQQVRMEHILDTGLVDEIAVLPEAFHRPEHHIALMKLISPHVLAVSSHSPYQVQKRQIMELVGGELEVVHEHNPEVSTTKLIEQRTMHEDTV